MDTAKLLDKNGRLSSLRMRFNLTDEDRVYLALKYPDAGSIVEAIHARHLGLESIPRCECGRKVAHLGSAGFSKWCGKSCAARASAKRGAESHLSDPVVRERIVETNLRKYGVANVASSEEVKARTKETCQERFGAPSWLGSGAGRESVRDFCRSKGVENASALPTVREKIASTNLKRHGGHPLSSEVVRRKCLETYVLKKATALGVTPMFNFADYDGNRHEVAWRCDKCDTEFVGSLYRGMSCPSCNPRAPGTSDLERSILDFVRANHDGAVVHRTRALIAPLEVDVYVPSLGLAFEVDGNYWHSELNGTPNDYHLNKTRACALAGVRLIHIFEDEIVDRRPIVESRLRGLLGKNERVFARRCEVRDVDARTKNEFLASTHIQGPDRSSVKLGLYHGDALVAVMTFGRPRYDRKHDWEMIRFSSALGTNVVGGAGKLLAHFRRSHSGSIVSYADRRWSA